MTAEVSSLVTGLDGSVVLAIFSSNIPGSFIVPRTLSATAALFTEIDVGTTSRQSSYSSRHKSSSCKRPTLPDFRNMKHVTVNPYAYKHPLLSVKARFKKRFDTFSSRMTSFKSRIYEKLGLTCLFSKFLKPFEPILKYARCKLRIKEDEFLNSPSCNADRCRNPKIENKFITRDLGIPNLDSKINGKVSTLDDCFATLHKMEYGARVRAKIVNDGDCEHERYKTMCEEEMNNNRVLFEDQCKTTG